MAGNRRVWLPAHSLWKAARKDITNPRYCQWEGHGSAWTWGRVPGMGDSPSFKNPLCYGNYGSERSMNLQNSVLFCSPFVASTLSWSSCFSPKPALLSGEHFSPGNSWGQCSLYHEAGKPLWDLALGGSWHGDFSGKAAGTQFAYTFSTGLWQLCPGSWSSCFPDSSETEVFLESSWKHLSSQSQVTWISNCSLKSFSGIERAKTFAAEAEYQATSWGMPGGTWEMSWRTSLYWVVLPACQAPEVVSLLRGSCGQRVLWWAFCFEFTPLFSLSQLRFINLWTSFSEGGRKILEGFWGTAEELSEPAFSSDWMFILAADRQFIVLFLPPITSDNHFQNAFSEHSRSAYKIMRQRGRMDYKCVQKAQQKLETLCCTVQLQIKILFSHLMQLCVCLSTGYNRIPPSGNYSKFPTPIPAAVASAVFTV